jgi:adenine-specific DNA-methyltransferase
MILEFRDSDLTKLLREDILSFKCENVLRCATLAPVAESHTAAQTRRMKIQPSPTKLRGGYYTPDLIASFLARWAIRSKADSILEPSFGDGVFVEAGAERLKCLGARAAQVDKQISGFELLKSEFAKALRKMRALGIRGANLHVGDFFQGWTHKLASKKFDVVLGNPPFIRYQSFLETQRAVAFQIMRRTGLNPNRLTNAWVPFLVAASLALKADGRLAMVIPAELLQVNYAAELRLFLSEHFSRIRVITFRQLAFEALQQEVVLILAERGERSHDGIEVLELGSMTELLNYEFETFGRNGFKAVDHTAEKWTQYYLSEREIDLIRRLRHNDEVTLLGNIAETDVGVVTGLNDFFVLSEGQVRLRGLTKVTRPLVSRSAHLSGTIFENKDWHENARLGLPVYLLDLPCVPTVRLTTAIQNYIKMGEDEGLNLGYKCRIRKFWYVVPSIYAPAGFLLRQIHHFPKLIANEANATSTDTIHRVRFHDGVKPRIVATAFLNSLTFAFSELLGRSYGGGVLELEPGESDKLPIPLKGAERLDPQQTDLLVRKSKIEEVLRQADKVLLIDAMGLSKNDVDSLKQIWEKLRERRKGRRGPSVRKNVETSHVGRQPLVPIEVGVLYPTREYVDAD